jgi:hypothetical protein
MARGKAVVVRAPHTEASTSANQINVVTQRTLLHCIVSAPGLESYSLSDWKRIFTGGDSAKSVINHKDGSNNSALAGAPPQSAGSGRTERALPAELLFKHDNRKQSQTFVDKLELLIGTPVRRTQRP